MQKSRMKQLGIYFLTGILGIPFASAALQISGALDQAITIMSSLFYPSVLMGNETVQIGFFKFMFFLIVFTAANWALSSFVFKAKGADDNTSKKAAAVISFAFGAISAFFMPVNMALATGGFITAIFTLLIPLGITAGLMYLAFGKFNKGGQHWIGLALIILNIVLIQWLVGVIV